MQARIQSEAIFLQDDVAPTLQGRLSVAVVRLILERRYPPGTALPSTRALAAHLGISRLTVSIVYQELASQGFIDAKPRSGFVVGTAVPHRRLVQQGSDYNKPSVNWPKWLGEKQVQKRVIRKPDNWQDYRYPFIYGQPDPSLFDLAAWRDCQRMTTSSRSFGGLAIDQYGRDDSMLVDFICSTTLPRRGIRAEPENVLITMGAQNALFMIVELLARPDSLAVMEEPGYPDFAETLRRANCPTHFQPIDAMGLDPAALPPETRLVMATPSHNIPTGITMPNPRRRELLLHAQERDFLIIEDDYEFEMSYLAPPEPALKSMDRSDRVIYVGSFSKSLFPSLRIGYIVCAAPLIERLRALRSIMLRHAPIHLQRTIAHFLAQGYYDAHIVRLRRTFRGRRSALVEALNEASHLSIAGAARQGGSSIWVRGPDGLDSDHLAAKLKDASVLIEPGAVFFEKPHLPCPFFRMGYSTIPEKRIAEGVNLIARATA